MAQDVAQNSRLRHKKRLNGASVNCFYRVVIVLRCITLILCEVAQRLAYATFLRLRHIRAVTGATEQPVKFEVVGPKQLRHQEVFRHRYGALCHHIAADKAATGSVPWPCRRACASEIYLALKAGRIREN